MSETVLCLNTGSTSVKFALHELTGDQKRIGYGEGAIRGDLWNWTAGEDRRSGRDGLKGLARSLCEWAEDRALRPPAAVAHRIVHGGPRSGPVLADSEVIGQLHELTPLAPLHQPTALALVDQTTRVLPDTPQTLSFDTAFHRTMPAAARTYAVPFEERQAGVQRFGFHGLVFRDVSQVLSQRAPSAYRIIAAHLGGGSSLCALLGGRSVATTMGMTALDGVPMTTRCGSVDPGVVLQMVKRHGVQWTENLLYKRSGLAGLSGTDGDVRSLLASDTPGAALALDVFADRVAQSIASLTVPLGGLDMIVFSGGIGTRAKQITNDVIRRTAHLRPFEVLYHQADEQRVLAQEAREVLITHGLMGRGRLETLYGLPN